MKTTNDASFPLKADSFVAPSAATPFVESPLGARSSSPYGNLSLALRDSALEQELGVSLKVLSEESLGRLLQQLDAGARAALQTKWADAPVAPEQFQMRWQREVLREPLSVAQRRRLDEALLPRYSAAIEVDEAPRLSLPLRECGEQLVHLPTLLSKHEVRFSITEVPYHAACGSFAMKPRLLWCRSSVAERFVCFARACQGAGVVPHIEDVYRPKEVQAGLFRRRYGLIKEEFPTWSEKQILMETKAKTASSPFRAAHMGGAAIDVTLRLPSGEPLPLGNAYPVGGSAAVLHFPYVTEEEWHTRALFAGLSAIAGLCPYPGEDWHVSRGDGLGALLAGETEIRFGPLAGFNLETGEPVPLAGDAIHEEFSYRS
jgi:D-alanyl-D-alanine dipeptidase